MGKYIDTKEHKDWSKKIRERDGCCVICGKKGPLQAHHLIPKEFEKTRSDLNNGIALCGKHHMRFGHGLSPHSHGSLLFSLWLMKHRPDIIKWVEENWEDSDG